MAISVIEYAVMLRHVLSGNEGFSKQDGDTRGVPLRVPFDKAQDRPQGDSPGFERPFGRVSNVRVIVRQHG